MKKITFLIVLIFLAGVVKAQKSLYAQDTLAANPVFKQRVKSATINAANQIAADLDQPYWSLQYANEIIKNPDGGWISGMTFQVVANPVIEYTSPDDAIQFTVNSNFEKVAKAFINYLPPGTDSSNVSNTPLLDRIRD